VEEANTMIDEPPIWKHLDPESVAQFRSDRRQEQLERIIQIEQLDYITKQEEWLRESLRPFMPKSIFKSAYGLNKKRAGRWLKSNGFHIIEDQARGGKFLYRGNELVSSFTPKLHLYGKQQPEQSKSQSEPATELANA
jgi:hypothetical protein